MSSEFVNGLLDQEVFRVGRIERGIEHRHQRNRQEDAAGRPIELDLDHGVVGTRIATDIATGVEDQFAVAQQGWKALRPSEDVPQVDHILASFRIIEADDGVAGIIDAVVVEDRAAGDPGNATAVKRVGAGRQLDLQFAERALP